VTLTVYDVIGRTQTCTTNVTVTHETDVQPCAQDVIGALYALRRLRLDPGRTDVAGALALYNRLFAVALPPVFLAIGGRDGFCMAVRLWRHLGSSRRGSLPTAVAGFGILCVGLIYLGLLSPDSVNYDATWYHLRIAQDYARWGRIRPFFDYNAIVPHLASILHTWGYLVPGLDGAPRWMMALHMEFALFLWTLVGVAAGIQRLTDDFTLRASWGSFFLFPIIFVYDSNIGGSADHVLAFFVLQEILQIRHVSIAPSVVVGQLPTLGGRFHGRTATIAPALRWRGGN